MVKGGRYLGYRLNYDERVSAGTELGRTGLEVVGGSLHGVRYSSWVVH